MFYLFISSSSLRPPPRASRPPLLLLLLHQSAWPAAAAPAAAWRGCARLAEAAVGPGACAPGGGAGTSAEGPRSRAGPGQERTPGRPAGFGGTRGSGGEDWTLRPPGPCGAQPATCSEGEAGESCASTSPPDRRNFARGGCLCAPCPDCLLRPSGQKAETAPPYPPLPSLMTALAPEGRSDAHRYHLVREDASLSFFFFFLMVVEVLRS